MMKQGKLYLENNKEGNGNPEEVIWGEKGAKRVIFIAI